MAIHLRQICLVAEKLAPAIEDLATVLSTPVCHMDPAVGKFGVENSLLPVGTQFLEVVAPIQDNTAAGRYLRRKGGDGGYMVITQVSTRAEQQAVRTNATRNDVRIAYDSDRGNWDILQLHPGDMGAAFLEVDWDLDGDATGNWHPAGGKAWMDTVSSDVVSAITAAELQSDDPQALARRWSAVLGLALERRDGVPVIALANANLRFVEAYDGRGAGLGAVDLRVADRDRLVAVAERRGLHALESQVLMCGTRFNLNS